MTQRNITDYSVPCARVTYFAGSNTADGFQSRFPDIFDEHSLDRLCLIKGGPGTGKNTFMRRLCTRAADIGIDAEAFLCGSDPASLDALVLHRRDKTVAVIDSTPPHPYDPAYPGAVSTILDFGRFWNERILCENRTEITAQVTAKSAAYARAYRFLSVLSTVRRDRRRMCEEAIDRSKMNAACRRFAASLDRFAPVADKYAPIPSVRIANAVSMAGECFVDPYPDFTTVTVADPDCAAPAFFSALADSLRGCAISFTELRDSVDPELICGFILPDRHLRILPSERAEKTSKNINLSRFLSRDILHDNRNKRSFARRICKAMTDGVCDSLAEAATHHFALEKIYRSAMDFHALNEASEKYIADILAVFD